MSILLGSFLFVSLVGCSTSREQQGSFSSFITAYSSLAQSHHLSKKEARQLPYATLQVSLNDSHTVLMPLGHKSPLTEKWYSQDRFGFTAQSGRITQIYNTDSEISAIQPSPLWQQFKLSSIGFNQQVILPMQMDFLSLKRFGVHANVTIEGVGFEERELWGESVTLLRIEERIEIPSMNYRYINRYWKDTKTNFIWESIQKWGPDVPEIHYKVLNPWISVAYP